MGDRPEATEFPGNDPANPLNDKAPARAQEYRYDSLPPGLFIRMLTLYPGGRDDPLKGKLEFFDIDSSKSYEPLSYVWGAPPSNGSYQIAISNDKGDGSLQLTALWSFEATSIYGSGALSLGRPDLHQSEKYGGTKSASAIHE